MTVISDLKRQGRTSLRAAILAAGAAVMAAGCSADVTRFDSSSFALNDPPEPVYGKATRAAEAPPNPAPYDTAVARSTPRGPYGAGAKSVEVAALPDATPAQPVPPVAKPYPSSIPAGWKASPQAPLPAATASNNFAAPAAGQTIEVAPGDTLYKLSKQHRVPVAELMAANSLTTPALKPGQKLVLRATGAAAPVSTAALPAQTKPAPVAAAAAPAPALAAAPAALVPLSPDLIAKYGATYTVKPGDSLYQIARAHKVPFTELQQVNAITDVLKVKPGAVLKVPGLATAAAEQIAQPAPLTPAQPPAVNAPRLTQAAPASPIQPALINGNQKVASLTDKASDAVAQPSSVATAAIAAPKSDKSVAPTAPATTQAGDSIKLRWPAQGKIIAGFGGRPDGLHNDGINLSVPLGTDVHAAESGVVAYAGSELKGYGNLILIRHDNGWVTAYAHNDELLVKRGDKITRGQVVAKAGKTGQVEQPQVHFELRQGSKPVDPTPYMERL